MSISEKYLIFKKEGKEHWLYPNHCSSSWDNVNGKGDIAMFRGIKQQVILFETKSKEELDKKFKSFHDFYTNNHEWLPMELPNKFFE